jgi:hypothetical protein
MAGGMAWGQFGAGLEQGYRDAETARLENEERKKRLQIEQLQADKMRRDAEFELKVSNAPSPQLNAPPQMQPGQPSQPMQPPQGAMPPAAMPGQMPPPPMQGGAPGVPGMPGTPGGPAPMPPQAGPQPGGPPQPPQAAQPIQMPPSAAAAAARTPPGQMPPYMAPTAMQGGAPGVPGMPGTPGGPAELPPPPTPEKMADTATQGLFPGPVQAYKSILQQLEKSNPGFPQNSAVALAKVEQFKPIYDAQRADELGQLKIEVAGQKAAVEAYKATVEGLKARTGQEKVGIEKDREKRLASLTPFKMTEIMSKIGLNEARAKTAANTGNWSPEEKELLAAMADKNVNLPVGMRSQQQIHATLQGLLEKHAGETPEDIAGGIQSGKIDLTARTAEARTIGSGVGRLAWATNEIDTTAPLVLEASKRVPRGSFIPLNKLMTQYRSGGVQDPDQKELAVYINSMLNAYDLLAARGGTDVKKREEAHQLLLASDSPESLERNIEAFKKEAAASQQAADRAMSSASKPTGGGPAAKKPMSLDDYLKSQGH